MTRTLWLSVLFLTALVVGASAEEFAGSEVMLAAGIPHVNALDIEAGSHYDIGIRLRSEQPETVVSLAVVSYDAEGEVLAASEVQRGLSGDGKWQTIGVEVFVPQDATNADLRLEADVSGKYFWDALTIRRLDPSPSGVSAFWEERLSLYSQVYTGLVVDGRSVGAARGMSPRIWSESGLLLYGGRSAGVGFVQDVGVAAYGPELTPELMTRIQADPQYPLMLPLEVEAVGVKDPARTNLVVSDADAERILQALAAYDFFARFAVVILVD